MSDSKPNRSSIPDWQKPSSTSSNNSTSTPSPSSDGASRSALIEQASKFLQDESIRDASVDRKIIFLQSKGLRNDEIDRLLGVSRNAEANCNNSTDSASSDSHNTPETKTKTATSSTPLASSPVTRPSNQPSDANSAKTETSSSPRDVPPIITYPEFLIHQSKPPPLVTLRSILYTLYGAAGLGASIYGASEYLVKPMLENLTSARHDLAQTASANLTKLNEKLEQNVSIIPPHLTAHKTSDSDEETESITSDPTELFHRDVATQTSQDLEQPRPTNETDGEAVPGPTAAVNTHMKRLDSITSHLREFSDTERESSTMDDTVRTSLNDLQHYLDGLLYSKPGYGPVTGYGVYSTPGMDNNGTATGVGKGEEDAILNFKSEIRGVKGALLSARNFPTSRGRVAAGLSVGK
ncbi:hypothetical protein EYZ11_004664 [Aspergillus tanneri]|uniref:Peroxisomal membrane protein PEX14 n=1 Tax=Aspergillus tanneri TaxID=1220188 RepID=A0A4S3JM76_9EURO|nr:uncharacterized protein ATNIH1004_008391 [Aspergillus tanneri]KAA8644192.1 hypothetical protein ATNIH1004_008391 [Aspergillus tanneri]THC95837.1 hypothetical protein EYZ11_004664 [Aspergillus tanneri]